jgi:DNA-directed RNA polymerase subunit RPC12/RpoP
MGELHFEVSLPTDDGFIGRECSSPGCSRYFKVHADSLRDEMHCPYCNQRFDRNELFTRDQIAHAQEVASEQALEYASRELAKMFGRVASGSSSLSFKASKPYRARTPQPNYTERKVDSEIRCPDCGSRFQVDGIFAHCVGCGLQNIAVFDANLEVIRAEVTAADDPQRALRHAYSDLVSMFETICGDRARVLDGEHGSFQDPFEARRFFKKQADVDILDGLDTGQRLAVRRVFHKRHAWQHSHGVITERYVKKVPEDRKLDGEKAVLSMPEFEAAAFAVRIMIDALPRKAK